MPGAHTHGMKRICSASTTVENQSTTKVEGQLWAVRDTTCDHGDGQLINTTGSSVKIEGKPVIVHGPDHAKPNDIKLKPHTNPMTAQGSGSVFAYSGGK